MKGLCQSDDDHHAGKQHSGHDHHERRVVADLSEGHFSVLWCDVVWCGMVWCGVVWCGVVWCGVVWCGVVWCGVVWCGVVWCGVVWCGVVCWGVVMWRKVLFNPIKSDRNSHIALMTAQCGKRQHPVVGLFLVDEFKVLHQQANALLHLREGLLVTDGVQVV